MMVIVSDERNARIIIGSSLLALAAAAAAADQSYREAPGDGRAAFRLPAVCCW